MSETPQLGLAAVDGAKPTDDDLRLWSVTTIIGVLDKPGLMFWSAEEAARAACTIAKTLPDRIKEDGLDTVVKWLRDARFRRPKDRLSATALGSVAHSVCEEYALTGQRPDRAWIEQAIGAEGLKDTAGIGREADTIGLMVDQFDRWLQRFTPAYQATEVCVYSPTYGYAGTADGFLTIDGFRAIIDYKSTRDPRDGKGNPKSPYPEVALQLAAYRYAEMAAVWRPRRAEIQRRRYYLISPEERAQAVPVPEVDGGLVIHLTTEACEAYPVACGPEVHTSFLYVQEAARWHLQDSKKAIGAPLEAPTREAVSA